MGNTIKERFCYYLLYIIVPLDHIFVIKLILKRIKNSRFSKVSPMFLSPCLHPKTKIHSDSFFFKVYDSPIVWGKNQRITNHKTWHTTSFTLSCLTNAISVYLSSTMSSAHGEQWMMHYSLWRIQQGRKTSNESVSRCYRGSSLIIIFDNQKFV